ncbi:MAG: ATP-dependent Clp protease adaptor ClpS [Bacteroidetes bacterium]|jgi:ATP-dependent Clp protease adaptor protein ClpS|nr:MAG: Clp protease ClpS [Cryomorphaceae bacterium BACL29 MAG-121220-bin8]MDA0757899.1 ATP-dependent Clp protease adaptor ClpS [Bacteroidota bacterium]MDA1019455.1 ATP-dependent Clp protease adaptor ClpS [Bacteroidota bacterium]|tara:strand:- start:52345 stop:52620 length:276 start_codon:yes stop_codon:yes gene_type:complete
MNTKEKILEKTLKDVDLVHENEIIVYNDDVNTFEHVINTLVKVCDHTAEQAEQCSLIIHYKGKCSVKSGSYSDLKTMCSKLLDKGLSAEII